MFACANPQEKKNESSFSATLEQSFWCLNNTPANKQRISKAALPAEALIDPAMLILPEGVQPSDVLIVDKVVDRKLLGTGVGTRLSWQFCEREDAHAES